jgi:hypothetical protein
MRKLAQLPFQQFQLINIYNSQAFNLYILANLPYFGLSSGTWLECILTNTCHIKPTTKQVQVSKNSDHQINPG